jgi:methyl-accepting chemotaxis protein
LGGDENDNMAGITAIFDLRDRISSKLNQISENIKRIERGSATARVALQGTEHVIENMTNRLNRATDSFKRFNEASNNLQAQRAFS